MEKCIIETLAYFDLFDYPLTFFEIKKYLSCEVEISDDELLDIICSVAAIQESNGYFYLLGRKDITEKRNERSEISVQKYAKAKIVARLLSLIPTVQYIGVSGSLSMNNAAPADDIDFFIVTKKGSMWTTRILVNGLLLLMRQKRKHGSKIFENKICPNMYVEENKLAFTGKRRTLYTAHEIVQLKTLFDRAQIHTGLLAKNKWLSRFLPNIVISKKPKTSKSIWDKLFPYLLFPVERAAYILQLFYMRRRRSIEYVTKDRAFFHPIDRQKLILDMFRLRYARYEKIYNDNLWIDKEEARFYIEQKKIRILN